VRGREHFQPGELPVVDLGREAELPDRAEHRLTPLK
jgi:hypothetical protein